MKRLQRYYFLIGVPVLLIALGSVYFSHEILGTIEGNPHPQINYLILLLIVGGCIQMMLHVKRINTEGKLIIDFSDALLVNKNQNAARQLVDDNLLKSECDVAEVLELVLDTHANQVDSVQQAAIESEIIRFSARQNRRLLLAGFMSGMMVGLGLLGTFIGLLGALQEISKLIGSFSASSGMNDPLAAVNELVTRLTEPMKAMGVAFSASLFGVLGSLIMSMFMVFIKSATVELISLLETRVSRLTDLGDGVDSQNSINADGLSNALSQLAQQSPVLKGLIVAMDQSEKRVRSVVSSVQELVGHIQQNTQSHGQVKSMIEQLTVNQVSQLKAVDELRQDSLQLLRNVLKTSELQMQSLEKDDSNRQLLQNSLQQHARNNQILLDMQASWLKQLESQQQFMNEKSADSRLMVTQERDAWLSQLKSWSENSIQQFNNLNSLFDKIDNIFQSLSQESRQAQNFRDQLKQDQSNLLQLLQTMTQVGQHISQQTKDDVADRAELIHQLKLSQTEHQDRYEQLIQLLISSSQNPESQSKAG